MTCSWSDNAIALIEADFSRSADTHLVPLPLPGGVDLFFKDETTHPSGSLKHRLARSLFLYALCNGWLREGTTIIEASSGSTAISEAYFARLLDLRFIAVVPASTSAEKRAQIEFYSGKLHSWRAPIRSMQRLMPWRETGAISWINSPTRNGQPTGAATTILPSPSTRRWP